MVSVFQGMATYTGIYKSEIIYSFVVGHEIPLARGANIAWKMQMICMY
jgi:hypothetical protein